MTKKEFFEKVKEKVNFDVELVGEVDAGAMENQISFDIEEDISGGLTLTLNAININPVDRGNGYGTEIMEALEEIAYNEGIEAVQLEAFPPGGADINDIQRLVNWYKRLGYEPYYPEELQNFLENADADNVWYYSSAVNNPEVKTSSSTFWMVKEIN